MTCVPVVVFDLDGVLGTGDSLAGFVLHLLLRRPWRIPTAIPLFRQFRRERLLEGPSRAGEQLIAYSVSGVSEERIRRMAWNYGASRGRNPAMVIPGGMAALQTHLQAGDQVVIATATHELIAGGFLQAQGINGLHDIIGTRFGSGSHRTRLESYNIHDRKRDGLLQAGIDLKSATFYTDSIMDLPVARQARQVVLVEADDATIHRYALEGLPIRTRIL